IKMALVERDCMTKAFIILLIRTSFASFSTRYLPLVFLSKKKLSNEFKEWMNFVPVTIFSSLVAADIFFPNDQFSLNIIQNTYLIPSVLVLIVSLKTKNMLWSIIIGIASLLIMQLI